MSGIFDSLAQGWTDFKNTVTGAVQGPVDSAVQSTGTQNIASTPGSQQALGTAPEAPGTTMTGGKRHRRHKTRRSKKSKKTSKRRS